MSKLANAKFSIVHHAPSASSSYEKLSFSSDFLLKEGREEGDKHTFFSRLASPGCSDFFSL